MDSKISKVYSEWLKHPGLEVCRLKVLGPLEPEQGQTLVQQLEHRQGECLDKNDLAGARYYKGQIDILRKLFDTILPEWDEPQK